MFTLENSSPVMSSLPTRIPFVDFRTGQELSLADEAIAYQHWFGSVENGRRQYQKFLELVEVGVKSDEILVIGVGAFFMLLVNDIDVVSVGQTKARRTSHLSTLQRHRIWCMGMESIKQFCFDFIDNNGSPVDNPRGIQVCIPVKVGCFANRLAMED
jgi:hypothetical protein